MQTSINYDNINLPQRVDDMLQEDFWILDNLSGDMLNMMIEPVKFSSFTSIFVKRGVCKADINLISHDITGPCLVNVRSTEILQPTYISNDFDGSFLILSKRAVEALMAIMQQYPQFLRSGRHPVVPVPEELAGRFTAFYNRMKETLADADNPHLFEAMIFQLAGFFCKDGYKCYIPFEDSAMPTSQGRITDQFLTLAQRNFKKERFLEFYARQLDITPKHLSRTIKAQTGFTAVEWIERFIMLEAKVMLKSSTMNVQQIADELNFPSQSFFGKYFKKHTGMSPKEFRNS